MKAYDWAMRERVDLMIVSDVPVRMDSAADGFTKLDEAIQQWIVDHPVQATVRPSLAEPSVLEVFGELPQTHTRPWGLVFGHAAHDLRAALDHLAQLLCRLDGGKPANPKAIDFPVCASKQAWQKKSADLKTLPAALLARIEEVQPLNDDGPAGRALELLHKINILDKHYGFVQLRPLPALFDLGAVRPWPAELNEERAWDTPLARVTIDGKFSANERWVWPCPVFPVLVLEDRLAPLLDVQRWLYSTISAVLTFIATGEKLLRTSALEPKWVEL